MLFWSHQSFKVTNYFQKTTTFRDKAQLSSMQHRHAKNQQNTTHNEEKNELMKTCGIPPFACG